MTEETEETKTQKLWKIKDAAAQLGVSLNHARSLLRNPECPLRYTHNVSSHPTLGRRISDSVLLACQRWMEDDSIPPAPGAQTRSA